jgi:murein DD-endopeptidase MepM/ murein hydrolase activator NlpD
MMRRVVVCAAVVCVGIAFAPVSAADTTTTTPATTTTPTTTPEPTTVPSKTPPVSSTTSPAAPPSPGGPSGEGGGLSAEQELATQASFAALTPAQSALFAQWESARATLATRRIALSALSSEVAAAQEQLSVASAQVDAADAAVNRTLTQLDGLRHEIARLAVGVYLENPAMGALNAVDSINATDALALARARRYAQADVLLLNADIARLDALKRQLQAVRAQAEDANTRAQAAVADVAARVAAQTKAVTDADTASTTLEGAVANALGSGAVFFAEVLDPPFGADMITAALATAQFGQPDPSELAGHFQLPIPGAALGSPYGVRVDPLTGAIGFHPGIDFEAPAGTPIHAAADGVVVIAGDCGGYGNCVVIDHGTSLATVYAHQSTLLTQAGDRVTTGQIIGLVGSTGQSTGPHLHFEVRLHGIPIDPVQAF